MPCGFVFIKVFKVSAPTPPFPITLAPPLVSYFIWLPPSCYVSGVSAAFGNTIPIFRPWLHFRRKWVSDLNVVFTGCVFVCLRNGVFALMLVYILLPVTCVTTTSLQGRVLVTFPMVLFSNCRNFFLPENSGIFIFLIYFQGWYRTHLHTPYLRITGSRFSSEVSLLLLMCAVF